MRLRRASPPPRLSSGRQNSYVASGQLHLDYDLGWATVTSITGYVGTHQRAYTLPNGAYFTNTDLSDNNDYSEEFRIAGHDTAGHKGGLAWQVGAYLFSSTGDYFQHAQLGDLQPAADGHATVHRGSAVVGGGLRPSHLRGD